jgi:hypothetical protein
LVGLSDIFGPMFSDCCSLEMWDWRHARFGVSTVMRT